LSFSEILSDGPPNSDTESETQVTTSRIAKLYDASCTATGDHTEPPFVDVERAAMLAIGSVPAANAALMAALT